MMFDQRVAKAEDLGMRMCKTGFTLEDNPYESNQALKRAWVKGFSAQNILEGIDSMLAPKAPLPPGRERKYGSKKKGLTKQTNVV